MDRPEWRCTVARQFAKPRFSRSLHPPYLTVNTIGNDNCHFGGAGVSNKSHYQCTQIHCILATPHSTAAPRTSPGHFKGSGEAEVHYRLPECPIGRAHWTSRVHQWLGKGLGATDHRVLRGVSPGTYTRTLVLELDELHQVQA